MVNHKGTQAIETERLILRRVCVEDSADMFNNWASDSEVAKYLTWQAHTSPDTCEALMKLWQDGYGKQDFYHWGITLKGDNLGEAGSVIGTIGVVGSKDQLRAAELGYCIGRQFWGNGIMTEALSAVVEYLFSCGFHRLAACHHAKNSASGRVMEKCGFQREGIEREAHIDNKGGLCSVVRYAILATDKR